MSHADQLPAGEPPATPTEVVLGEFIEVALARLQRGEPVDVEALLAGRLDLVARGRQLVQNLLSFRAATPAGVPSGGEEQSDRKAEHEAAPTPAAGESQTPPTVYRVPGAPGPEPAHPDPFPGEYRIRRLLGEGAFGKVWLADDLHLGRPVALKTLRAGAGSEAGAETLAALRKEAGFLAGVDHRNIVRVYSWRQAGDEHYLVLQYVPGGSLAGQVTPEKPLDWQRAARYVADVGEGLVAVHAAGIVHRDIKPANILWDERLDEALLTDFGVSGRLADARTVAGTPAFMAPEAFRGRATEASDVYGLAATLFHLVTGEVPFRAPTWDEQVEHIRRGLPDPDARCRGLPEPLEQIIRAGLAADPERRPPLPRFIEQLRGALNQTLADALAQPAVAAGAPAPVELKLVVSREVGPDAWQIVAAAQPQAGSLRRDIKKVPPRPERARVRTGERVRVEVAADRPGYVTVFNVGPTGNLNLLYPEELSGAGLPPRIEAHRPVIVMDLELVPPAGRERLFAVWSREPLPLPLEELHSLVERGGLHGSRPYRASRDLVRVQGAVRQAPPGECRVAVLELEHAGS
jgi:hypothetical protein